MASTYGLGACVVVDPTTGQQLGGCQGVTDPCGNAHCNFMRMLSADPTCTLLTNAFLGWQGGAMPGENSTFVTSFCQAGCWQTFKNAMKTYGAILENGTCSQSPIWTPIGSTTVSRRATDACSTIATALSTAGTNLATCAAGCSTLACACNCYSAMGTELNNDGVCSCVGYSAVWSGYASAITTLGCTTAISICGQSGGGGSGGSTSGGCGSIATVLSTAGTNLATCMAGCSSISCICNCYSAMGTYFTNQDVCSCAGYSSVWAGYATAITTVGCTTSVSICGQTGGGSGSSTSGGCADALSTIMSGGMTLAACMLSAGTSQTAACSCWNALATTINPICNCDGLSTQWGSWTQGAFESGCSTTFCGAAAPSQGSATPYDYCTNAAQQQTWLAGNATACIAAHPLSPCQCVDPITNALSQFAACPGFDFTVVMGPLYAAGCSGSSPGMSFPSSGLPGVSLDDLFTMISPVCAQSGGQYCYTYFQSPPSSQAQLCSLVQNAGCCLTSLNYLIPAAYQWMVQAAITNCPGGSAAAIPCTTTAAPTSLISASIMLPQGNPANMQVGVLRTAVLAAVNQALNGAFIVGSNEITITNVYQVFGGVQIEYSIALQTMNTQFVNAVSATMTTSGGKTAFVNAFNSALAGQAGTYPQMTASDLSGGTPTTYGGSAGILVPSLLMMMILVLLL